MSKRIRITAKRREPIDIDSLVFGLLHLVDQLSLASKGELPPLEADQADPRTSAAGDEEPAA